MEATRATYAQKEEINIDRRELQDLLLLEIPQHNHSDGHTVFRSSILHYAAVRFQAILTP
jgi:hypothetical protein